MKRKPISRSRGLINLRLASTIAGTPCELRVRNEKWIIFKSKEKKKAKEKRKSMLRAQQRVYLTKKEG